MFQNVLWYIACEFWDSWHPPLLALFHTKTIYASCWECVIKQYKIIITTFSFYLLFNCLQLYLLHPPLFTTFNNYKIILVIYLNSNLKHKHENWNIKLNVWYVWPQYIFTIVNHISTTTVILISSVVGVPLFMIKKQEYQQQSYWPYLTFYGDIIPFGIAFF